MKKALLLSVVASSMIMAGGDIAPVEPAVETPAPVASGWEFSGTGVVYYQTDDAHITGLGADDSLFSQDASAADFGLQLRATNSDLVAGIGAGMEVSGLSTLNLENWMVSNTMQGTGVLGDIDDVTDGGWISQMYLTYGAGNTSIKAGRQELPKGLSPFAYSEKWNVFSNTFDAALIVNSDLPDTTVVAAWVGGANYNALGALNNITDFNSVNGDDGVYLLTLQNQSIANLTLTGSVYYGADMAVTDDIVIWWGDAAYDATSFNVAIQGGTVDAGAANDMTAFGAKVGAAFSGVNVMAAYSTVDDGAMFQIGGTTSALYTTTVVNQLIGQFEEDKFVVGASMDALGGNISAAYAYSEDVANDEANEFDLVYGTNVAGLDLTAAYAYYDVDGMTDSANVVRVVLGYNF